MLITFSTDPLYIKGGLSPYNPLENDPGATEIIGRSLTYAQGETRLYSIPTQASFATKPVYGQRESPETEITASVCYAYRTYVSTEVCIDTNIYQENQRVQSCAQKDITLTGGQGAPIAITQIEVTSLPVITDSRIEVVRPQFTIHIQDVGKGYLIGPDTLAMDKACVLKSIPKEEFSAVKISANLLKTKLICGQSKLKQTENLVRLEEGQGVVTCTVADEDLRDPIYSATQNFQTVLTVNLSYIYKSSVTAKLKIERILGSNTRPPTGSELGKVSGYMYDGDQLRIVNGQPVKLCEYYADHPSELGSQDAAFKQRIEELAAQSADDIAPTKFSCACDVDSCNRLGIGTNCFASYCPGSQYCCVQTPKRKATTSATTATK
jgi:hypothetical protein